MSSSWIITRNTKKSGKRYRVLFKLGGRESKTTHGGQFRTRGEALNRKRYIDGELSAMRVPCLNFAVAETPTAPMLAEACEAWLASRVDVVDGTRDMHRSALGRIWIGAPHLRNRRVDELTVEGVTALSEALVEKKYARARIQRRREA